MGLVRGGGRGIMNLMDGLEGKDNGSLRQIYGGRCAGRSLVPSDSYR